MSISQSRGATRKANVFHDKASAKEAKSEFTTIQYTSDKDGITKIIKQ